MGDVPIRIYRGSDQPTGLVVYFHGGGYVIGSIGLMDGVAREIAHASDAVVVSVGYRLAPEDPYPAGLDDCVSVTRWALDNSGRFGLPPSAVAVAGESAGGNMAATVSLRLRDAGGATPAGQVLMYPGVSGSKLHPSMTEFDGLVISLKAGERFWEAYSAGRDLDDDPTPPPSTPARSPASRRHWSCSAAATCSGTRDVPTPPDCGTDRVAVDEVCYPGQPHGFINFGFPAASLAFERTGQWLRSRFEQARGAD